MPPKQVTDVCTELVGRDAELRALEALLVRSTRVITVLGPAGVGKSRLARAAVSRFAPTLFSGGSINCDLQAATTPEHLLVQVNSAFNTSTESKALPRLSNNRERVLILLDNAEPTHPHLVRLLPEWLEANPGLHLIITTRQRLGVSIETVHSLAPLSRSAAVALLTQRMEAVRVGVPSELATLESLVDRLDRLPAAIEFAARYLLALTPAELLQRLHAALPFLRSCIYQAGGRAQSLAFALDATWHTLSDVERAVACSCALFQGPFSISDAEGVCPKLTLPVAVLLTQLCEKSLFQVAPLGPHPNLTMFTVLGLTREYLMSQSQAAGSWPLKARVAAAIALSVEQGITEDELGELDAAALEWLRRHQATLLWLADRSLVEETPAEALRMLLLLMPLVLLQGPLHQSLALLERVPLASISDPRLQCRGLLARARLRTRDGQLAAAHADLLIALKVAHDAPYLSLQAPLLAALAECQRRSGAKNEARNNYLAALSRYTEQADNAGLIRMQAALAGLAMEACELAQAQSHCQAALTLLHERPMPLTEAVVMQNLGVVLEELGDRAAAERCFRTALATHQALGHRRFEGIGEFDLGALALQGGALAEARNRFMRAVELAREVGDRREQGLSEALLSVCEAKLGELAHAARHLERARTILALGKEPDLLEVLEVHAGHLDLTLATLALLRSDEKEQRQHWRAAEQRLLDSGAHCTSDELRFAQRLLQASCQRYSALDQELLVTRDGSWFRTPEGLSVALTHRAPLQRLMRELVEQHLVAPGSALSPEGLARAVWPEQRAFSRSAKNRLHVALTTLRKAGLGVHLLRKEEGYLLDRALLLGRGPALEQDR